MKQVDLKSLTKIMALFLKGKKNSGAYLLADLHGKPRFTVRIEPYLAKKSAESLFAEYGNQLDILSDLTQDGISLWEAL